ncbi:MAG: hypothetical protein Q4B09_02630 [Lachnospiraceae bacterium]|nr:hypothetical protein [Lachnospiraceae bacterium]
MAEQNFLNWLAEDIAAARVALLYAIEERDRLLYVESKNLQNQYMEKVGKEEEEVLKEELEAEIDARKAELLQAAVNRRETIDSAKIEQQLAEFRKQLLDDLAEKDLSSSAASQLRTEEKEELQALYQDILRGFHPKMHPDITEAEKELYERALSAYERQNLAEMRLLHDMLFDTDGLIRQIVLLKKIGEALAASGQMETAAAEAPVKKAEAHDYTLAARLFSFYQWTEEEAAAEELRKRLYEERHQIEGEIEQLRQSFPFSAEEMLRDPEKTEEYHLELKLRRRNAEEKRKMLAEKISRLTEEAANGT